MGGVGGRGGAEGGAEYLCFVFACPSSCLVHFP